MTEIKNFRIIGEIRKGNTKIPFSVDCRALKEEHALQNLYAEMGSRHRARKFEIKITKLEEIKQSPSAEA